MASLNELTIRGAADGLRKKEFSCEDLLVSCLEQIELRDKELNAFITVDRDGAISSARAVDKRIKDGEQLSLLAGIPCGIKDLICTKGVRTTCASPIKKD